MTCAFYVFKKQINVRTIYFLIDDKQSQLAIP